jgi:hypothetical protein
MKEAKVTSEEMLTFLLLAVTPDAGECLLVSRRIPICSIAQRNRQHGHCLPYEQREHTRIKENQPVGTDEIDAASSRLAAQEEHELLAGRVVELVHHLLALRNGHRPVEPEESVPGQAKPSTSICVGGRRAAGEILYFLERQSFSKRSSVWV